MSLAFLAADADRLFDAFPTAAVSLTESEFAQFIRKSRNVCTVFINLFIYNVIAIEFWIFYAGKIWNAPLALAFVTE